MLASFGRRPGGNRPESAGRQPGRLRADENRRITMRSKVLARVSSFLLVPVLLIAPAVRSKANPAGGIPADRESSAAPPSALRIVGPAGEDPPVVNERKKLKLRVIDGTGADVPVNAWRSASPTVAKVTKKGVLKGHLYGFATLTAETGRGEAVTTVVVARVTRQHGSTGDGDMKSDSAGRIYLSSPDEQIIYRSDGIRDEIFAGSKHEAGYQEGVGPDARFHYPTGLGVDVSTNGGLFVADTDNHCIRRVGFDGRTSVAAGSPTIPGRIDADFVDAGVAVFDSPKGVASRGTSLFVADTRNHALYYFDAAGATVSLVAGSPGVTGFENGPFRDAEFNLPSGLAINTTGDLLAVADTGNDAVRLVRVIGGGPFPVGKVSTVGVASAGRGVPGGGTGFSAPASVAFDSVENVCVVDALGASIITRAPDGTERTLQLAQQGSLGRPASVVVSGTRAIVADSGAGTSGLAIAVVEVGPPQITSVTPSVFLENTSVGRVVIEGANFPPEARVVVDGQVIESAIVESATRIVLELGDFERGSRLISVLTRGGVAQREIDVTPPRLEDLQPGMITTYAGSPNAALGDGGRATDAALSIASVEVGGRSGHGDVRVDGSGNVFVASPALNRIRRVDAQTGVISTIAGTGKPAPGVDGQPGVAFGLDRPMSTAVGPDGAIFVADSGSHRVVRVDPLSTEVRTIIGSAGIPGSGPDGDVARPEFLLTNPVALATDQSGNLYISDFGNGRVLRVDAATRIVRVVAGGGPIDGLPESGAEATSGRFGVTSLAVDSSGEILAAVFSGPAGRVVRIGLDGRLDILGSGNHVAVDSAGNAYVTFQGPGLVSAAVRRIDRVSGTVSPAAGGGRYPSLGDGGPANGSFISEGPIAVDGSGRLFLVDSFHDRIRTVDASTGVIATLAGGRDARYSGDGRIGSSATFSALDDVAWIDGMGLAVSDTGNGAVRVIDAETGVVATRAGGNRYGSGPVNGGSSTGIRLGLGAVCSGGKSRVVFVDKIRDSATVDVVWRVGPSGKLEFLAGGGADTGDDVPAARADLGIIRDVVRSGNGDVLITDGLTRRIRRIDGSTGLIRTVAGRIHDGVEYSGDGGPAVSATLEAPGPIAVGHAGDLYIADGGRILHVPSTGIIETVAGGSETGNPLDGQPIAAVRFGTISALAADAAGDLFISDEFHHVVVRLDFTAGVVRHVAGIAGVDADDGDGLPAAAASIGGPSALAFDPDGNLYVSSRASGVIRVIRNAGIAASIRRRLRPAEPQRLAHPETRLNQSEPGTGAVGRFASRRRP